MVKGQGFMIQEWVSDRIYGQAQRWYSDYGLGIGLGLTVRIDLGQGLWL